MLLELVSVSSVLGLGSEQLTCDMYREGFFFFFFFQAEDGIRDSDM